MTTRGLTWGLLAAVSFAAAASACGSSGNGNAAAGAGGSSTGTGGSAGATGGTGGADVDAGGTGGTAGADVDADTSDAADAPAPVVDQIPGVTVSTLAGSSTQGAKDGTGADAQFNNPVNVIIAPTGDLIVADFDNALLRRVTTAGVVTTLTSQSGFVRPFGLAYTPSGTLIAETDWNNPNQGDDTTGALWSVNIATGAATLIQANLGRPRGLVAMSASSLFMADPIAHYLRLYDLTAKTSSTLAGVAGVSGFVDGSGANARFNGSYGSAKLPDGNVVLADLGNDAIRMVTPAGVVTTVAGDGTPGMVDGSLSEARFDSPRDVAVDAAGRIYVSDNGNHRIRVIDVAAGTVRTVAGKGTQGYQDGAGGDAQFFGQEGLDVTSDGKTIYVADGNGGDPYPYHRIRKIQLP